MAIYQDKLGRMWFGTREGVNIYNSNKMAVYKAWIQNGNRPDQKILIGNEVSAITGSQNGDVFLIVDHALLKYDIRKETFERLRQGSVYALTSHAGEIWCAGHDSIFRYNPQNNQLDFQLKNRYIIHQLSDDKWQQVLYRCQRRSIYHGKQREGSMPDP